MNKKIILEDDSIILDNLQSEIFEKLLQLNQKITNSNRRLNFFNRKKIIPQAIYLWGEVGRGKSMLMKLFYKEVKSPKKMIHFHSFMLEVHKMLKDIRSKHNSDPVKILAKNIIKDIKILCLDELEIKDIADAMLIGRLFKELIKNNIIIVTTSNCHPDELYKNGLKRENFLEFIDLIKEKFEILSLNSDKDYRIGLFKSNETYLTPLNEKNNLAIEVWINKLSNGNFNKAIIEVFGRQVKLKNSFKILNTTEEGIYIKFSEICVKNLGTADYEIIAKRFHIIILKDIPILYRENRNEVLRFIKLIDILYENKNILICSADAKAEQLYVEGEHLFEFKRTISRLEEMQSDNYIGTIIKKT